jgi:hypothetical protein
MLCVKGTAQVQEHLFVQGCGSRSAFFFEDGSGSALRVNSWIRIRIKVKFKSFKCSEWSLKGLDPHNGGLEAQNGVLERL